MKRVFICHPVGGKVKENIGSILAACFKIIHGHYGPGIIPATPYIPFLYILEDELALERALGIVLSLLSIAKGEIDELWLFGDRISEGILYEIALTRFLGIPVIPKTEEAKRGYRNLFADPSLLGGTS